ncbi:MAG TPA: TerC family protein [Thermomicrobiales bacterium]|nr:TerC family protein [Thermomicrobiales bacterium]
MEADFIAKIASIVLIDLVLSGDNAVVIGMAARRLPAEERRRAIVFGGVGAVVLRVTFTILAALLLDIPLLRAIGGVLLLWIAYKLVRPHEDAHNVSAAASMSQAVKTIILADFVMSLDNILAVGGASEGHLGLLIFGLLFSIPILMLGSELVARVLGRLPILLYVGVVVLIVTATRMILHDDKVKELYHANHLETAIVAAIFSAVIIGLGWRAGHQLPPPPPPTAESAA